MSKRFCSCGALIDGLRCKACKPQLYRELSSHARGYGSDWVRTRNKFLDEHPCCADCEAAGRLGVPADEVHHIVPILDARLLRLEWATQVN